MNKQKKQYILGALLSYGAIVFNIISGLIYTPWMISTIGKEHYALYTLASSVISLFLLDFGIGGAVSKFLSNYYANKQYDQANKFMGIVYKIFILISVIIAVCLFVFYFLIDGIYTKLSPSEIIIFKHLFIIVSVYSVFSFPFITFNGILMANELFIQIKACNFGQKFLNVFLIVGCLLFGADVYALVIVHAFSNVVFIILKYFIIKNKTLIKVDFTYKDRQTMRDLFDYSVWMTVMSLAQRLIFNIMPSLIAALIGSVQVTLFSLASVIEGYVYTFTDAINGMFLPKISRIIVGENPKENLSALLCKVGKFHVYTLGLMFVGFVCVGKEFVNLWLGDGYEMVYICAVILILPSLIDTPQQIAKTALLATDVVKEQGIIYLVMAICNILFAAILLPTIGIVGGAISVCIAYFVRTICLNILYYKKLQIDLKKYFASTYGIWLFVVLVVAVIYFPIASQMYLGGWLGFLIRGCIVFVLYIFLLFIGLLIKRDSREMLKRIIKKVAKK